MKGPAGPLSDTSSLAELARKPVVDEVQMKVLPAASNAAGASCRMSAMYLGLQNRSVRLLAALVSFCVNHGSDR